MQIVNKTGSNRVYIDREKNENISFPKDQPVEVDDTTGILLKIDGFEIVKEEKKRKKEGSK